MSEWEKKSESDEWYTPKYIFDALDCRFNLDVAGLYIPGVYSVPAAGIIGSDGLEADWNGFVWMNPPFGGRNGLQPWLEKFFAHRNGIALTPDRTSAPWFRYAWARANWVMFLPKVKFLRPDGSLGKQPGCGTALWGVGYQAMKALQRAHDAGLGILAEPTTSIYDPMDF